MEITKVSVTGADGDSVEAGYFTSSYDSCLQLTNLPIELDRQYTLHGYIKSSASGTISCSGVGANVTTSWQEVKMTITPTSKTLFVYFYPATFWIYNWKLEVGDVSSYWTPSPLDAKYDLEEAWSTWEQTAEGFRTEIGKKTDESQVRTLITASADDIRLKTGKLVWEATNSSMDEDGNFKCTNGDFTGKITATDGTFSGMLNGATGTFSGNVEAKSIIVGYYDDSSGEDDALSSNYWLSAADGIIGMHAHYQRATSAITCSAGAAHMEGTAAALTGSVTCSEGSVIIQADNELTLNDTNWDTFKSQHGYDWSTFNTENTTNTWVPVMNGSKVNHRVIPADAFSASASGIFRRYGKVVVANFYGTSTSSLPWVPEGWQPTADVSIPVTVIYNSNPYMGYLQIHTGRWMECKYYNYGSLKGTPQSGSVIYGVAAWVIA